MKSTIGLVKKTAIFAVIIFAWYFAAESGVWSPYVLPSPAKVGSTLVSMISSGELASALLVSLQRIIIGFAIACIIAFALVLIAALIPRLVPYYSYLISMLRHIPPISLIPLLILWFGIGETPKIIVIVLASMFPILLNTENAIFGCDKGLLDVGRTLGFSRLRTFFSIRLPNALPNILVGMRVGFGYAWRAIVAAEMIAAATGLGALVLDAQTLSRTDKVIAGVIVIGVAGLIIDRLFALVERRLTRNREKVEVDARL